MPLTDEQQNEIREAAYKGAVQEAQQQGWLASKGSGTDKICRMIAAATLAGQNVYDLMIYGDDDGGY